jgi:cell division protein FtsI (penicillin-binding protein 3)
VVWRPTSADHPVLRAETARTVLGMMERVMEKGGTGDKIKVPGFRVGGKTGTAKKLDPVTRKYTADKYLSSFSGIVPVDDPRLVIVVMIDEPSAGKYYGGAVAGPAFARIAAEALKYMGIAPTEPVAPEVSAAGKERAKRATGEAGEAAGAATGERSEADDAEGLDDFDVDELAAGVDPADLPPAGPGEAIVVIPDFTGMSVGQAVRAARAAGVQVEIDGSGRATKQFPGAGRALKSITCRITFDPG